MWIKICGMTTPDAVSAALTCGVDAIGFVFAISPRRVTPAIAAQLAAPARGRAQCVAVMRHPTQAELDEVLAAFRPDVLQSDVADLTGLRLPHEIALLPVLRAGHELPETVPARVLFEGPQSGAGVPCDWTSARAVAARTQLVLAGGLDADNVGSAIRAVRPFGVDVSSGVERSRGVKSAERIGRFVEMARAACRGTGNEEKSR